MIIHVEYKGLARIRGIESDPLLEMPAGSTIADLYLRLGIREADRPGLQSFINNDATWSSTKLKDGDRVVIVSALRGG